MQLVNSQTEKMADPMIIELSRVFAKDLLSGNGTQWAQPIVKVANATTNARFYNDAYVPTSVKSPYFKLSINGLLGFVGDDMKSFTPQMPMEEYNPNKLTNFVSVGLENGKLAYGIKDTVGLMEYLLLNMMFDGVNNGFITHDKEFTTALGSKDVKHLYITENALDTLMKRHPLYPILKQFAPGMLDTVTALLGEFPDRFPMPSGADISSLMVGVPQLEIGSIFGTELLVRYIPPLDLGSTFGDFSFWGLGLKHSISQYFNQSEEVNRRFFDLSIQGVWQSTKLKNSVGVTNSQLTADASIYNINIHASKEFEFGLTAYGGISYEQIDIDMVYSYLLPIELQWQLNMIDQYAKDDSGNYLSIDKNGIPNNMKPTEGHPGDTKAQFVNMALSENQIKFTAGVNYQISNILFAFDYSFSKFNIFSFAVQYTVNKK